MKREQAERIATEFLKPIYGFALKRCANLQDAEDLTQEIVLKVYRSLLSRDSLDFADRFIWTAARNTLANYYRDRTKTTIGVPIDDLAEVLPSGDDTAAGIVEKEAIDRLHMEIARLSKLQRRIVIAYYFENKKQETIADELGIPLGTVKWHLFEAKNDLKRGFNSMRQASELKFNPIKFEMCLTNGSPGTKGANNNFFRSALSQNIAYSVYREAKSINEIADCLGVSPVYVESEAEYLCEYGFLTYTGGKYLSNILIDEPTNELVTLHDEMYGKAAKIFANELYDELTGSGIPGDGRIACGQTDGPISTAETPRAGDNFILWSIIPYIAALSGEKLMDDSVSFEDAATLRPDGGHNICKATVMAPGVKSPLYYDSLMYMNGPCWNVNKDFLLWQIDSEWSARRVNDGYIGRTNRILSLFSREREGTLSEEEYAFLAETGMAKAVGSRSGKTKAVWQIVVLEDTEIKNRLIAVGDRIMEKHWAEFEAMKAPYVKAKLDQTPEHLRKVQKYGLQFIFFSDGWFILHCLKELVNNGRLKPPTEEQKKALTTIIVPSK